MSRDAIFGAHGVPLREAGLAVLPARGKSPLRANFNKWKHAPGIKTVERWAERNPDANIAVVPGLSRNKAHPYGIVVVDVDDVGEVERALEAFGGTPAMVDTRRGKHLFYAAPEGSLGTVGSLRKSGLNIDIKHGQAGAGIVVAPPSRHESGHVYRWSEGSGIETLRELPPFNIKALSPILGEWGPEIGPNDTNTARPPGLSHDPYASKNKGLTHFGFREGSRGLGLNAYLVRQAYAFDDLDAVLDAGRTWNVALADRGIEPLPDAEVIKRCKAVWRDVEQGKIVRMQQRRATARTDADEVRALVGQCPNGGDAVALLMLLRAEHDARCRRGETFAINVKAMVEAQTLRGWSKSRLRAARDALLEAGHLEQVTEAGRWSPKEGYRRAAQYRLTDRVLTPSIAVRTGRPC